MIADYLPASVLVVFAVVLGWRASATAARSEVPAPADLTLTKSTLLMVGALILAALWGGLSSALGCPEAIAGIGLCRTDAPEQANGFILVWLALGICVALLLTAWGRQTSSRSHPVAAAAQRRDSSDQNASDQGETKAVPADNSGLPPTSNQSTSPPPPATADVSPPEPTPQTTEESASPNTDSALAEAEAVAQSGARVDGRGCELETAINNAALRLSQGQVAVVFSSTVTDDCNNALAAIAELRNAARYVAHGSEESPEAEARVAQIAGPSVKHAFELALAIAGRAYDVVLFVDTSIDLPEVALERFSEADCVCLGSIEDRASQAASVFLAARPLVPNHANPIQANAPSRVELLRRILHRLTRLVGSNVDTSEQLTHPPGQDATVPTFAPPPAATRNNQRN